MIAGIISFHIFETYHRQAKVLSLFPISHFRWEGCLSRAGLCINAACSSFVGGFYNSLFSVKQKTLCCSVLGGQ